VRPEALEFDAERIGAGRQRRNHELAALVSDGRLRKAGAFVSDGGRRARQHGARGVADDAVEGCGGHLSVEWNDQGEGENREGENAHCATVHTSSERAQH
jgi:hypothetical protein